jgi:hypothetical protein
LSSGRGCAANPEVQIFGVSVFRGSRYGFRESKIILSRGLPVEGVEVIKLSSGLPVEGVGDFEPWGVFPPVDDMWI